MRVLFGLSTLSIVFMVLMLGTAIVEYQEQPQNYSWIDANGEFKTTSYDVTVSYNLHTPLDELNGYSLNEVFNENLEFTRENMIYYYGGTNEIVVNYNDYIELSHDGNGSYYHFVPVHDPIYTADYYMFIKVQSDYDVEVRFEIRGDTMKRLYIDLDNNDNIVESSDILTLTYFLNGYFRIFSYDNNTSFKIYDAIAINLTDLGINQTAEEMDYWYSEYQRLQENRIEDLKFLGGEVVSQWTTFNNDYLQPTLDVIALYVKWLTNPAGVFIDLLEDINIIDTIG